MNWFLMVLSAVAGGLVTWLLSLRKATPKPPLYGTDTATDATTAGAAAPVLLVTADVADPADIPETPDNSAPSEAAEVETAESTPAEAPVAPSELVATQSTSAQAPAEPVPVDDSPAVAVETSTAKSRSKTKRPSAKAAQVVDDSAALAVEASPAPSASKAKRTSAKTAPVVDDSPAVAMKASPAPSASKTKRTSAKTAPVVDDSPAVAVDAPPVVAVDASPAPSPSKAKRAPAKAAAVADNSPALLASTTEGPVAEPYGSGSATPAADGSGPDGWTIKGNAGSMLFHTTKSPYYKRTKAEAWFETEAAAEAAGFTRWDKRTPKVSTATTAAAEPAAEAMLPLDSQPVAKAPVVEAIPDGPYGPGSAAAGADGSGPTGWTIKGNADSMLFHTSESPYYKRTKAEAWFQTEAAAEAAGFTKWAPRRT